MEVSIENKKIHIQSLSLLEVIGLGNPFQKQVNINMTLQFIADVCYNMVENAGWSRWRIFLIAEDVFFANKPDCENFPLESWNRSDMIFSGQADSLKDIHKRVMRVANVSNANDDLTTPEKAPEKSEKEV